MGFPEFFAALERNTPIALLAVALLALAWIVRDSRSREVASAAALQAATDKSAAALQAANEKHADEMRRAFDAHLQTAMQVAPLASKLVTCVEVLERLSVRVTGGA